MITKQQKQCAALEEIYDLIVEDPDFYKDVIGVSASAWSHYKEGYTAKEAGMECLLYKCVNKKKAQQFIDNRKKQGWPNLDMFPRLEEALGNIINKT